MSKDTGGPAFPCVPEHREAPSKNGMTLRDYFAAKAMQAMISSAHRFDGESAHLVTIPKPDGTAIAAYNFADAMIAERAK